MIEFEYHASVTSHVYYHGHPSIIRTFEQRRLLCFKLVALNTYGDMGRPQTARLGSGLVPIVTSWQWQSDSCTM
jgi:hypothetical protein